MTAASFPGVGIVGVGAIGQFIARAVDEGRLRAKLLALADQDREKMEGFVATLRRAPLLLSTNELVRSADLIVEAASADALRDLLPEAFRETKDVLVMSVGGLLGHPEWFDEAERRGCRIHIPSGALAGVDGLKSAAFGQIERVTLESRKPVAALKGAKYVVERRLELETLREDTMIFEGTAGEACRAFPATANIAATLFFAARQTASLQVRIIACPESERNVHQVIAEGNFGRFQVVLENVPFEANPRTSKLAALSALASLEESLASRMRG